MRRLLKGILIFIAAVNLVAFLVGLAIGIIRDDFLILSVALTTLGLFGMTLSAVVWCIQSSAIQYSMETSYYRDVMNVLNDGIVRTSVIHTAPACTSILDSDSEHEEEKPRATPRNSRNSAEEQWLAHGEKWRNEQLRLSMERENPHLVVFPYSEASPHRDSMNNMDALVHEFSRLDSIKRPHSTGKKKNAHNHFQVRCIGMSAEFIERFNK
ncbi:unnamed protein product [Caenorhabditis bovis]|uniref:Uncharacterized protein n=1 Tax=Caenorhabditis bovis TaxID=2654633 RepID=A0A8S1EI71_9PELO|nr:unnamed protein product [Caenorhabditis bovis]